MKNKYRCYGMVDNLSPDEKTFDDCMVDDQCVYKSRDKDGRLIKRKEDCKHWRPIEK